MIRIPTGTVPKNAARNISLGFGLLTLIASIFAPQYSDAIQKVGIGLTGLGLTLGKQ